MYDGLATVSDNFAFLAHAKLMNSWDALEVKTFFSDSTRATS
jgi:hypothetical protein